MKFVVGHVAVDAKGPYLSPRHDDSGAVLVRTSCSYDGDPVAPCLRRWRCNLCRSKDFR